VPIYPPQWEARFRSEGQKLASQFGLRPQFAYQIAQLVEYQKAYGLSPRITSGFRDPAYQAELRRRWDAGDRAGLRARPAANSAHSSMLAGKPAADAIDIVTADEALSGHIASALGITPGTSFTTPDPGHYAYRG